MSFSADFLAETARIAAALDSDAIERMAGRIADVRARSGRMFFIGSGGGAGHASHAVNDFRKIAGIECYTPTDNVSELTARINDDGWETSYVNWLRVSRFAANDALFVFSVGGGDLERNVSTNLVRCIEYAKQLGATILGVVGKDGGYTAKVADVALVVPPINASLITPHTEGFQAVVWHLLVSHPLIQQSSMKWESLR